MTEAFFSMGFLVGLLGFAHCAGMCGGIAAALTLRQPRGGMTFLVFYQAGRIATYTLLGLAGAALGGALLYAPWFATGAKVLLVGSDLFVILLGLAGLGLIPWLGGRLGSAQWLEKPLGRLIAATPRLPAPLRGVVVGLALGLLPCGLLYPVLLSAIQTAQPVQGALTMLGFGLGTAPALLLVGGAAARLRALSFRFLKLAWLAVVVLGSVNLYRHLLSFTVKASCCGG